MEELDEHFRLVRLGSKPETEHAREPREKRPASLGALLERDVRAPAAALCVLREIAQAQQWPEPLFVVLPQLNKLGERFVLPRCFCERSSLGRFQCLVQIASTPLAVCYGSGVTQDAARSVAARNALEYLKIVSAGCALEGK